MLHALQGRVQGMVTMSKHPWSRGLSTGLGRWWSWVKAKGRRMAHGKQMVSWEYMGVQLKNMLKHGMQPNSVMVAGKP